MIQHYNPKIQYCKFNRVLDDKAFNIHKLFILSTNNTKMTLRIYNPKPSSVTILDPTTGKLHGNKCAVIAIILYLQYNGEININSHELLCWAQNLPNDSMLEYPEIINMINKYNTKYKTQYTIHIATHYTHGKEQLDFLRLYPENITKKSIILYYNNLHYQFALIQNDQVKHVNKSIQRDYELAMKIMNDELKQHQLKKDADMAKKMIDREKKQIKFDPQQKDAGMARKIIQHDRQLQNQINRDAELAKHISREQSKNVARIISHHQSRQQSLHMFYR
jgi:hypothetical protein